jgi:hypothetical protein
MSAATTTMPAQFAPGTAAVAPPGNGVIHKNPSTHHKITGTQTQCKDLLAGLRWLSPYSFNH